jgi:hypothetical protein
MDLLFIDEYRVPDVLRPDAVPFFRAESRGKSPRIPDPREVRRLRGRRTGGLLFQTVLMKTRGVFLVADQDMTDEPVLDEFAYHARIERLLDPVGFAEIRDLFLSLDL